MAAHSAPALPIRRLTLRLVIGESLMSGSDDPLFLGLHGPQGREFRVRFAKGASLRRGHEEHYCIGPPDDSATNVANPAFNDPTLPPIDAAHISSVYLRKGFEPIPNVRGLGEMDDRLEVIEAELAVHVAGRAEPLRYLRRGPIWLGLLAGLRFDLPPADEAR